VTGRRVHRRAEAFDAIAEAYERGRPGWPEAALDAAAERLRLGPDARVLDLAAGTGKLTRALARRFCSVTAVEPLDGMRAVLERSAPGATVLAGTAEDLPLSDAAIDAVWVAEAFHWFDAPRAVAEMARVVGGGGGVAVLHNGPDPRAEPPWQRDAHAAMERHRLAADDVDPEDATGWRAALESRFPEVAESVHDYAEPMDRERLLALFASFSSIAGLPADRRKAALADLRGVLDRHGVQDLVLRFRTVVVTARRP
jgi:ubiquinone/menaquinone biosynthesis C-methylase UbiE